MLAPVAESLRVEVHRVHASPRGCPVLHALEVFSGPALHTLILPVDLGDPDAASGVDGFDVVRARAPQRGHEPLEDHAQRLGRVVGPEPVKGDQ